MLYAAFVWFCVSRCTELTYYLLRCFTNGGICAVKLGQTMETPFKLKDTAPKAKRTAQQSFEWCKVEK